MYKNSSIYEIFPFVIIMLGVHVISLVEIDYWPREETIPSLMKRNGVAASFSEADEELIPLASHEAPVASSDDLSVADSCPDSCPDTSSKYHSCEAVETDDELRH